jgi:mono/diheme cytochrome c family protein
MVTVALLLALQAPSPVPRPPSRLSPFARAKAEALLSNSLPCLGCHELGGDGGRVGPSLSRLRGTRTVDFVIRMMRDPERQVSGTVMPRSLADSATQDLIARYLVERDPTTPAGPVVARPPAPTRDTTAAARYARRCAPCHGAGGRGDGPNAPFLPVAPTRHADAAHMSTRPDDALYDAIAAGGAVMGRSARMPGFGGSLTPQEIRGLVAYLRVLCRCEGPDWSREP